jgi:UDPglucose 6-dehydrogenase
MLASRISFMNQMADLCERVGADVVQVRRGIAADKRIGQAFLLPGPGYGGSCLPKDVRALIRTALGLGMGAELFEAIEAVNRRQLGVLLAKVHRRLGEDLRGRRLAVWGLAFKAGTDDMRESPAIPLVEGLLSAGAEVRAHDPEAGRHAAAVFGDRISIVDDPYDAAEGADALVVVTEWMQYRTPDLDRLHGLLRHPLVIDGRNLYDPDRMTRHGFEYVGVGRGEA